MRKIKIKTNSGRVPVISAKVAHKLGLAKISDIARAYNVLPSAINFYTREGLIIEHARTPGGYRLYHRERTVERLRKIEYLQTKKRLTIEEIKRNIH